jgi:16S rRNA (guanine966-N2)-methyltransferase
MLRITGGVFRGRTIQTPRHDRTRPTQGRLRQALFNSLQAQIPDSKVLDLFAGSGALGFEALSRGAQSVTFIESDRSVAQVIHKNAELLNVHSQIKILADSVEKVLPKLKHLGPFDVILADPPYEAGWEEKLLKTWPWNELLSVGGCFCLEWGVQKSVVKELSDRFPYLVKTREKNYGDSMLTTFTHSEEL